MLIKPAKLDEKMVDPVSSTGCQGVCQGNRIVKSMKEIPLLTLAATDLHSSVAHALLPLLIG